jgi:hypothetical protein
MSKELTQKLVEENQSKIDGWKDKHKTVKVICVKSKINGEVPFIIGKPTAAILSAVRKYESDGKTEKSNETLKNSCILAGNKSLFAEDVDLENAVMTKVADLLERLEVEEKEL